ncbi:DsbA family protein [Psychromonas sp. KJ10-2]|uniref:DsbA family protein n=1 Tax=Psychromonas sp. KJ10-2 TaxID=3391822 RepID=UPI0039B515AD
MSEYIDQAARQVEKNRTLGNQLEVTGTPTVFVNNERMHGGLTAQQLAAMFK